METVILLIIIVCCWFCIRRYIYQQNTQKKNKVQPDIEAGYPINRERSKVKPKQLAIKITDLVDSSSVSQYCTTTIELPLDSTNDRDKEYDVAMRAHKENGTLLWTNTDKVNKN